MATLLRVDKDGKYVGIDDEYAPIPHSLTRVIKESGNYGLAQEARRQFKALALKDGEVPGPVGSRGEGGTGTGGRWNFGSMKSPAVSMGMGPMGRGRGRGRILGASIREENGETEKTTSGSDTRDNGVYELFKSGIGEKEPSFPEFEAIVRRELSTQETEKEKCDALLNMYWGDGDVVAKPRPYPEDYSNIVVTVVPAPPPDQAAALQAAKAKGKATKTNGYCLFMRYMARETGTDGTISELMVRFDQDWKSLTEEERQEWKMCAKTGKRFPPSVAGKRDKGQPRRSLSSSVSTSTSTSTTNLTDRSTSVVSLNDGGYVGDGDSDDDY